MIIPSQDHFPLVEYDKERAIAFLKEGKTVIPLWLDEIYQKLWDKLMR